jgi:hypothetical protein
MNDERYVVDCGELAVGFCQPLDGNEHRDTLRHDRIDHKQSVTLFFRARTMLNCCLTHNRRENLNVSGITPAK